MTWMRLAIVVAALALAGFGINYTRSAIRLIDADDPRAAAEVLRKGVEAGDEDSEKLLAALLEEGRPSKTAGHELAADPAEAFRLYEKIAASGNQSAMLRLGILYATGRGVDHDPRKAMEMFRRSGTLDANNPPPKPGQESTDAWRHAYMRDIGARVGRYPPKAIRQKDTGTVTLRVDAVANTVQLISTTAPDYMTQIVREAAIKALALVPPPRDLVASGYTGEFNITYEIP